MRKASKYIFINTSIMILQYILLNFNYTFLKKYNNLF
jgi:hypothetical protein